MTGDVFVLAAHHRRPSGRTGHELVKFTADDFASAGFDATNVFNNLSLIRDHEQTHVDTLSSLITDLGGTPVEEAAYDFGYGDVAGFIDVAAALENTGVDAYTGAAQFLIDNDDLLTAALTIHGVEARHAAYLNLLTGVSPFPDAVDAPLTPDEVVPIATQFIVAPVAVCGDAVANDTSADTTADSVGGATDVTTVTAAGTSPASAPRGFRQR